jgi:hypothetical protein
MIKVIDLYSGNPRDFTEALSGNFAGVIFRAGQGMLLDVPRLQPDWWNIAGDKGLLRGWYWVCDSRVHSSKHVEVIRRWRDDWKLDLNAELGLWSDVEFPYFSMTTEEYWKTPYAGHKNVVDFQYLLETSGINAGLYSADGVYNEIMKGAPSSAHDYLAKFRMWPANYPWVYIPGVSKPRMFGHWTTWTFWQYHGNPDYNDFNGTDEEFYQTFGGTVVPPVEPPTGETMYGTVIADALNVRNAPSITGVKVRTVVKDNKLEADKKSGLWWHLTKINGVATVGENWASEGPEQEYIRTDAAPPVATLPVIKIHLEAEGYPNLDTTWTPS